VLGIFPKISTIPLRLKISGLYLQPLWELSSAGSEHLPYKQGVAGSNPAVPTLKNPIK
jgi:hypothetical protein